MRSQMGRWLCVAVCCASLSAAPASEPSAPSAEELRLLELVRATFDAQVQAIRSVEGEYTYASLNPIDGQTQTARCRFAVSGGLDDPKSYHAQYFVLPDGTRALGRESAWDGSILWQRSRDGLLFKSTDATAQRVSSPLPHAAFAQIRSMQAKLALEPAWRLISAAPEGTLVRLEMEGGPNRSHGTYWHDLDRGGWMVRSESSFIGEPHVYTRTISYGEYLDHGNRLYYPIKGRRESRSSEGSWVLEDLTVDPDSLRINQPIPAERFRLEPTPDEAIYDQDLGWVVREPTSQRSGPPNPTTRLADSQPGQRQWAMPPPAPDPNRWALPAGVGSIILIGAGIWLVRRRTRRA